MALQLIRLRILATLRERWTTRVIVSGAPLVAGRPYRFVRHPNYVLVACEIAVVPLALGLPAYAAAFTILHVPLLLTRIQVENRALVEVLALRLSGEQRLHEARERIRPLLEQLVARGHEQGTLRADVAPADVQVLLWELGRVVVDTLLEQGERVVCEPDIRNTRMLAYCQALGGQVAAELELPDELPPAVSSAPPQAASTRAAAITTASRARERAFTTGPPKSINLVGI